MDLVKWIARHTSGWEYFVPGLAFCAIALARSLRSKYRVFAPWAIVVPWAGTATTMYLHFDVDRHWYSARNYWYAMTSTLVIVSIIPFAATSIFLYSRWGARLTGPVASGTALAVGVVAIVLSGMTSELLAQILLPLVLPR